MQHQWDHRCLYFKRNKKIVTKPGCNLTDDELVYLQEILAQSDELRKAYALKECFYKILRMPTKQTARYFLRFWLDLMQDSRLAKFKSLMHSFTDWFDGIINAIHFHYFNGFMEGHNNKIKVLKRVCFGIRNFSRFPNRILFMDAATQRKRGTSH